MRRRCNDTVTAGNLAANQLLSVCNTTMHIAASMCLCMHAYAWRKGEVMGCKEFACHNDQQQAHMSRGSVEQDVQISGTRALKACDSLCSTVSCITLYRVIHDHMYTIAYSWNRREIQARNIHAKLDSRHQCGARRAMLQTCNTTTSTHSATCSDVVAEGSL